MHKFNHFVGIDISKLSFDVALIKYSDKTIIFSAIFCNDAKGFKALLSWLKKEQVDFSETLFCMEFTGVYSQSIAHFLTDKKAHLWVEMSLKIIRSMGIQRGKNDKVDAQRIALFALKNQSDFVPYQLPRKAIQCIKILLNTRETLIQTRSKLTVQIHETARADKALSNITNQCVRKTLQTLAADIKKTEARIQQFIDEDEELRHLQDIVTSVPGVGKITFYYLLYFTNAFQNYSSPKQLACYCGVVPFEYTSGSSVKGKPRVHSMANKTMKRLLHTAALSAIQHCEEMSQYYLRKQKEGKNKMLILNNIRNKIVLRIAAVVHNDKPYIPPPMVA